MRQGFFFFPPSAFQNEVKPILPPVYFYYSATELFLACFHFSVHSGLDNETLPPNEHPRVTCRFLNSEVLCLER